jgi:hypothetical protein
MEKSAIIFDKVSLVMHDMGPIAKSKRNTQQNYSFRGIEDLMNEFAPIATKHGIFPVTTSIQDITNEPVTSRAGGSGYRTVRRFTFRFYASDGSLVETTADGEAIDYGDKSSNKAYSVAYREAIFKMFIVPFAQDDIENHDHELKEPTEASKQPTRRTSTPVSKSAAARELPPRRASWLWLTSSMTGKRHPLRPRRRRRTTTPPRCSALHPSHCRLLRSRSLRR